MLGWDRLREFQPNSLHEALSDVESLHAKVGTPAEAPQGVIEQLRIVLGATHIQAVPDLAGSLERRQIVAIADLLATRPGNGIARKAVVLAKNVMRRALVARSWTLMANGTPEAPLAEIIREGISAGHQEAVSPEPSAWPRIESWFESDDLPQCLLNDMETQRAPFGDWITELPRLTRPVRADSHLADEIRARLLSNGNAQSLRLHHSQLLAWVKELSGDTRTVLQEHFSANYLNQFRENFEWREDIIEWMMKTFGRPAATKLVDSWRRIDQRSPGVVKALLTWLALKDLERFFAEAKDPHGRFKFWRDNFSKDLVQVQPLVGRAAMLLHIPPLAVVEFADMGNAAYVYPESELSWLTGKSAYEVAYYKRREKLLSKPSDRQEFRILHFEGWQQRYVNDLKVLISGRTRRR